MTVQSQGQSCQQSIPVLGIIQGLIKLAWGRNYRARSSKLSHQICALYLQHAVHQSMLAM